MPIELPCPGCGQLLRVAEEAAGKPARCPQCGALAAVPSRLAEGAPAWHLRTPEGQAFGPADRPTLDRWLLEGRITADCSLAPSASGPWQPAEAVYPQLAARLPIPPMDLPAPGPGYAGRPPPAPPYGSPAAGSPAGSSYLQPHRGGLILVLGIAGLFFGCPIPSFFAWVMGSSDLQEMAAGRMDPNGDALTRIGQVLGMVVALLWIGGLVLTMLLIVIVAQGA